MRISVVGNGYVGLATAVGFAGNGHRVVCIDNNSAKVDLINQGKSPVYEKGLDDLVSSCVVKQKTLRASGDYNDITDTDITFLCVGTYSLSRGGTDFAQIAQAAEDIGAVLAKKNGYHVVAVKSTVAPGTTEQVIIPALEKTSGKKIGADIGVAVNPEFLEEGKAVDCFLNPYRVIIGEYDKKSGDTIEILYRDFSVPIIRITLATAEMIKYASNAFLSVKISFINEIGNICKRLGIDVYDVANAMGHDPRIGRKFLNAGAGFGGSCLPKDIEELIDLAKKAGYDPGLLESVRDVNRDQPLSMVAMAEGAIGDLNDKTVAVLGLSFKPHTDDMRDAPSLRVISSLLEKGASVRAYDPVAMDNAHKVLPQSIIYCKSAAQTIENADCVLIVTEWDEFKKESLYNGKVVIDGRRVLDPRRAKEFCDYHGICW
ncbi:MAG: UDP-glucose/GDP-mannose dehydrogenase family protein [Dehalococcoidia bacterium]|jgi:UDPglucose 6-dehydrogenase